MALVDVAARDAARARANNADGVAAFTANGWTPQQWVTLHEFFTAKARTPPQPGALSVALWLRHPRRTFDNPVTAVTPDTAMDVYARHGKHTTAVLTAMIAGASERFTVAFLGPRWLSKYVPAVVTAWQYATDELGLCEPHATGWALTGLLDYRLDGIDPKTPNAYQWVNQVGPDAYLWVLAGFTLAETVDLTGAPDRRFTPDTLRTTCTTRPGSAITEQQLRVMAALNGHTLPDGI